MCVPDAKTTIIFASLPSDGTTSLSLLPLPMTVIGSPSYLLDSKCKKLDKIYRRAASEEREGSSIQPFKGKKPIVPEGQLVRCSKQVSRQPASASLAYRLDKFKKRDDYCLEDVVNGTIPTNKAGKNVIPLVLVRRIVS